jgi:hypothetical protein
MLPTSGPGGTTLTGITQGGNAVSFTTTTVKGQQYAMFPATAGGYQATYSAGGGTQTLSAARTLSVTQDAATVQWQSDQPGTATVELGTSPTALTTEQTVAERTEQHQVSLDGLAPGKTYYYRVSSTDTQGRKQVWPNRSGAPATFTTKAADTKAPLVGSVNALSLPDGTAQVTWTTNEPATSRVSFGTANGALGQDRMDDALVTDHSVVLTGLDADTDYWLRVGSADAAGNSAKSAAPVPLRTEDAGVAVQTAEEFHTGTTSGRMQVGTDGLGELTLQGPGTGSYVSGVIDSALKVDWRRAVVDATRPAGSTVDVEVRTGSTPVPDGSWSSWRAAGQSIGTSGRYLEYRVSLTATSAAVPTVSAVGFTHSGHLRKEQPENRAFLRHGGR